MQALPGGSSSPAAIQRSACATACTICTEHAPAGAAVRLACRHGPYCLECLRRYAEARLEVGGLHLPCPECATPLAEHELRDLLPVALVDRLLSQSLEQAVAAGSDIFACPTPDCQMRVAVDEGDVATLKCPMCKRSSCLRCGAQPFHRGLTCAQHAAKQAKQPGSSEAGFRRWMEKTGTKQCPGCRVAVSKEDLERQGTQRSECHKMLCRICGTRFCFSCVKVLTPSFTCGCSIDMHGFVNPHTGKRLNHFSGGAKPKGSARSANGRGSGNQAETQRSGKTRR